MNKTAGARLGHRKPSAEKATEDIPMPARLTVPMAQCMGAPCEPLVKKGDRVTAGMKIGDSDKAMSVPVHSPASGMVADVTEYRMSGGGICKAAVIETDGLGTVSPEVKPPVINSREAFIAAVRDSGCCGLGGAGFPTHIKLGFDPEKTPVDTLIINAAECEPYVTSDYREMLENTDDVCGGIEYIAKMLDIPECIMGIEADKPAAAALMKKRGLRTVTLPSLYPQGAEKVLIYALTGRTVCEGEIPADRGVIVMNVSTVGFLMSYFRTGMPLVSRRVTVDGDAVKGKRGNYRVPVGTPARELLEYCGAEDHTTVLYGGPMMGSALDSADRPVTKVNNALLAFKDMPRRSVSPCIRCGRCISACPVRLMPVSLEKAYDRGDTAALERLRVKLCINCGCCSYVCPAGRRLAEKNQLAKTLIRR